MVMAGGFASHLVRCPVNLLHITFESGRSLRATRALFLWDDEVVRFYLHQEEGRTRSIHFSKIISIVPVDEEVPNG